MPHLHLTADGDIFFHAAGFDFICAFRESASVNMEEVKENPLGSVRIPRLLVKFAIPSIIAMLVNALYNIVDQIFIGNGVGYLGNAATNICFPFTTFTLALALMCGQGGASQQNLALGSKDKELAENTVGNTLFSLICFSLTVCAASYIFLEPLLWLFGSTEAVFPYAKEYASIIVAGLPLMMISTGINNIIRADGSPVYSMISMLSGAVLNTVLDAVFVFVFRWGIAGAAYATVIGQGVSLIISAAYLFRTKHIKIRGKNLRPQARLIAHIAYLGIASFINQISFAILQIVLNNQMTKYGALSEYGPEIPLACSGIVVKVNMIFMAVIIGLAQASQPITSFNYGAKKYARVRRTYLITALSASVIACLAFAVFQLFPRQIISVFGEGSELYFKFAERCFRILLFGTFLNGIQPVTGTFMTSIGHGFKGMIVSLTRQILLFLPLCLIFPLFWGIDGILYAMPISDAIAFGLALLLVSGEFRSMKKMERAEL